MSKYTVKATSQFKKDYKLAKKRGTNTKLLDEVIKKLADGERLPEKITITRYRVIGKGTENVMCSLIGCWFIILKMMYWC